MRSLSAQSTASASQSTAATPVPRLRLMPRADDTQRLACSGTSARRAHLAAARTKARGRLTPVEAAGAGGSSARRATRGGESPVLVAGGKPSSRAAVLRDLTETMPSDTRFDEAWEAWELLALAPESRMVVLSGDLDDISAKSAMHMLAHRHPEVPVVCLEACA